MKKILITGANGYIGSSLKNKLNSSKYDIHAMTKNELNLLDTNSINSILNKTYFDVVIHSAVVGGSRLSPDDETVYTKNIQMFNNLYNNRLKFGKFIHFGSGAEIFHNTFYAKSKNSIHKIVSCTPNFYNLRIFGVFDENELPTRFIKSNIFRYLNKSSMEIHTNKVMDFIYMNDLVKIVEYFIDNESVDKTINCSYKEKYTLQNIADMINSLDIHSVPIVVHNKTDLEFYCGNSNLPYLNMIGLKSGIIEMYNKIKGSI